MKLLGSSGVYAQVWWITAVNAVQITFVNRWSNLLFILGKTIRLAMSLAFLLLLKQQAVSLVGYTSSQVIVFYLTYLLVDVVAQIFFRGVYGFGNKIRTGEFDFFLTRPISPLFRALTGQPDINDALFLIPTLATSFWLFTTLNLTVTWHSVAIYLALLLNSLLIATGLHIFVLVAGILTTEADNFIWTYRDLARLGQFPATMYMQPLRSVLFFLVPIGLMITIPAQALLEQPLTISLGLTFTIGIAFFGLSWLAWQWALKQYTSASS